jgi:hypothetical protein
MLNEAMFSRELESLGHGEVEFALLRLNDRLGHIQRLPNCAQNAQAAFDPVWPDGIGNWQEMAATIAGCIMFHAPNLK